MEHVQLLKIKWRRVKWMKKNLANMLTIKIIPEFIKKSKKNEAEQNKTTRTAALDLGQVLLSPYGPTGAFYYSKCLHIYGMSMKQKKLAVRYQLQFTNSLNPRARKV